MCLSNWSLETLCPWTRSSASPRCHSDSRHPSIQKLDDIFSRAHLWTIVSEGKFTTEQCVKINLHKTFHLLQIELAAFTFFHPLCPGSSIISTEYYLVTSEHMGHLQICCSSQRLYYSLTALLRQSSLPLTFFPRKKSPPISRKSLASPRYWRSLILAGI